MDKATISFAEELMMPWMAGWPEYTSYPLDDHSSIVQMSEKIAKTLKVELSELQGFNRVCQALTKISHYCKYNMPWAGKNLHFYNRAYQTLYNEMAAKKRMSEIRNGNYSYKKIS